MDLEFQQIFWKAPVKISNFGKLQTCFLQFCNKLTLSEVFFKDFSYFLEHFWPSAFMYSTPV